MIIFLSFLLMTVSLAQTADYCLLQYSLCAHRTLRMEGADRCSASHTFVKCLADVTERCSPVLVNVVKGYQMLIEEGCRPESTFFNSVMNTGNCVENNLQHFEVCELEGEFYKVVQVCSSADKLIECFRSKTEEVCGKGDGKVFRKVLKPVTDFLGSCERSILAKVYTLSECQRGLIKCTRHIRSHKEYTCSDLERNAECYLGVLRNDCGTKAAPYIPILERYVTQIPEYCNPESDFRKSFAKSRNCIFQNFSVILPCHDQHSNSLTNSIADDQDDPNEVILSIIRANLQLYECIAQKLGTICGKEAAFVARYVLSPVQETMDDRCFQLAGKTCNGAIGLKCSIILLILGVLINKILRF